MGAVSPCSTADRRAVERKASTGLMDSRTIPFCSLTGDGQSVHPVMMRTTAPLPLYRVMQTTYRIISNIAPGIPASALMSTVIRSIGT